MADSMMQKITKQSLADMQSNTIPHPYYGPCDSLRPDGSCAECHANKVGYRGPSLTDLQYISDLNDLTLTCHEDAVRAGWWPRDIDDRTYTFLIATKFALIHSEISEALEAYRKNTMDINIPDMKGVDIEMADIVIRLFDLAGALHIDLISAIAHKRRYNAIRADHKLEARNAPGGKRF